MVTSKQDIEKAEAILTDWLENEHKPHPLNPTLPLQREFHYRKSGDWLSWNDFLATPPNTDEFKENALRDKLEWLAWQFYIKRHAH